MRVEGLRVFVLVLDGATGERQGHVRLWDAVKSKIYSGYCGLHSTLLTGVATNVIIQRIIYEEARYLCYIPCV